MAITCKPEGTATIDPGNPNNIIVTFVVRDAGNNIVLSQNVPAVGKDWTVNKAKYYAEVTLNAYLSNAAASAAATAQLPNIQAFINLGAVLATG